MRRRRNVRWRGWRKWVRRVEEEEEWKEEGAEENGRRRKGEIR